MKFYSYCRRTALTVGMIGGLVCSPGVGQAIGPNDPGLIDNAVIPAAQSFACGAGVTFTRFGVSTHGNLIQFESPAGNEHILVATLSSGYQVCYQVASPFNPFLTSWDFGATFTNEASWSGLVLTSQPNGAQTFPLEITRTTADGRVRVLRRITGNSFVGPVPVGNSTYDNGNFDGQGCSSLGECGNCTNRTAHVLTRITNISGGSLFNVRYVEGVDFDVNGTTSDDRFHRTADSVAAHEDVQDPAAARPNGMLLQALILQPSQVRVDGVGGVSLYEGSPRVDCNLFGVDAGSVTPTAPADPVGYMMTPVVSGLTALPNGGSSGNNLRVHYRRY